MKKLSREAFNQALCFMRTDAKDVEHAVFEYRFGSMSFDYAMEVLMRYQTEDGGFCKLDYDLMYPFTCVKSTENACRHLLRLNPPAAHPVILKLVPYLMANYNIHTGKWDNILVPGVNNYPHAPWWAYTETSTTIPDNREDLIKHYEPNINAVLTAFLMRYREIVPKELLHQMESIMIDKLHTEFEITPYNLKAISTFLDEIDNDSLRYELAGHIKRTAAAGLSLDRTKWGGETGPCKIITSPQHPLYEEYQLTVEQHLDFIIDSQHKSGSWLPDWQWGEPDVWNMVTKRLQGVLTLRNLIVLDNFKRIDF